MKKKGIALIWALLISSFSWAQEGHNLTFFTDGGEKFFVVLDGKRYNTKPDARVEVKGYKESSVRVKIFFVEEKWGTLNDERTLEGVEPGWNNLTYRIRKKTRRKREFMDMSLDKWEPQDPKVKEKIRKEMEQNMQQTTQQDVQIEMPEPIVEKPVRETPNQRPSKPVQAPKPADNTSTSQASGVMSDSKFNQQLVSIAKKSFENEKLSQALNMVKNNSLTVSQIKLLLAQFTFENNKLDIAKAAYGRCAEKDSYFEIGDEFTFSTNRDALMQFIEK